METDELSKRLQQNLGEVRERIEAAARRCGRDANDVRLVAVTKYASANVAGELVRLGCEDLGESRPQRLWEMAGAVQARWHLIGRLQRNKVARTLPLVSLIHSIDSERLLEAVNAAAMKRESAAEVLLEAHLSGEEAKQGFSPGEVEGIVAKASDWPHVRIAGLMTMAPLEGGPDAARRTFAQLRELRQRLALRGGDSLTELSMGMSGDYEVAIEEGATIVRVGSALFEGLPEEVLSGH